MLAFRLCRAGLPLWDGEGAKRAGGRWNSRGTRVIYLSENRSLAVLEVLVRLSDMIPEKYILGIAQIGDDISVEAMSDAELPRRWATLEIERQNETRKLGDEWVRRNRAAVLSVPSATSGERNFIFNPEHPEFAKIAFREPVPLHFVIRLRKPGLDMTAPYA